MLPYRLYRRESRCLQLSESVFSRLHSLTGQLERSCLGFSVCRLTPFSRHSTQQQTNKVITSTSQLIKQLSDIISGSSRQDRLRLTRLKAELSESVQLMSVESPLDPTPSAELLDGPLFGEADGSDGGEQAFLSEISEEDVEVLHQREEALLQIERDMLDVSQIMKDLASMVHEQGDAIGELSQHSSHILFSPPRNCWRPDGGRTGPPHQLPSFPPVAAGSSCV
uniref:t-SNARE coiled-coil homology domain-containing protein n=1 Tax=Salarias fasciatus TaxID=181472 RepID=A0A672G2S5_SALFA